MAQEIVNILKWNAMYKYFELIHCTPETNIILDQLYFNKYSYPGGSDVKESTYSAGDLGSIPVLGRSRGGGNGNPLQYSCLKNSMDREAWQATVHGVTKSWTQLSS